MTDCLLKVQSFFNLYAERISWKVNFGWMDSITKKREKLLFTYEVQCINTKSLVRDMYAAGVRYHLGCWLGVTVQACWSCAIVTIITTIRSGASATNITDGWILL